MKRVVHFRRTFLAGAPDDIVLAINRHTDWEAEVLSDPDQLARLPRGTLVHFHNRFVPYDGPQLIQYHSEPENPSCWIPARHPDAPSYRLVVAQYQATLPEYSACHPVRNPINFDRPLFDPEPMIRRRIGYSPSTKLRINRWFDKGFHETAAIVAEIERRHEGRVEVDVIHGAAYEECIRRKAACAVLIDECQTGSYHRCTLEGLALGRLTICRLDPAVAAVAHQAAGSPLPVISSDLDNLPRLLEELVRQPLARLARWGAGRRRWMQRYWHPRDIAWDFVRHYETVMG